MDILVISDHILFLQTMRAPLLLGGTLRRQIIVIIFHYTSLKLNKTLEII